MAAAEQNAVIRHLSVWKIEGEVVTCSHRFCIYAGGQSRVPHQQVGIRAGYTVAKADDTLLIWGLYLMGEGEKVNNCIFSVLVAIVLSFSLGSLSMAQTSVHSGKQGPPMSRARTQTAPDKQTFDCHNPKLQSPGAPRSKRHVILSWKASVSLSSPPGRCEGYNLYRLNPDGSCTKINGELIRGTVYEDWYVEVGKSYRYGAKAVKQNNESGPSNVVPVTISPPHLP